MDALSLKTTGDFIESFMTRTSGKARGIARLGSYTDLGIFTRHEDIRVVVICTDLILRNSSKIDDLKSVYEAVFPGECVKHRVVCAILSSGHFDIGVVLENGCTRAVFGLGSDWDCALELILTFIKSKSPEGLAEERGRLCHAGAKTLSRQKVVSVAKPLVTAAAIRKVCCLKSHVRDQKSKNQKSDCGAVGIVF